VDKVFEVGFPPLHQRLRSPPGSAGGGIEEVPARTVSLWKTLGKTVVSLGALPPEVWKGCG
jgi:hypothetical protein